MKESKGKAKKPTPPETWTWPRARGFAVCMEARLEAQPVAVSRTSRGSSLMSG